MSAQGIAFVVGQKPNARENLKSRLEAAGLTVETYRGGNDFLRAYGGDPGCLVLDVRLPDMTGLELQQELARRGSSLRIVFLSRHRDINTVVRAIKAGAEEYLTLPVANLVLIGRVNEAIAKSARTHQCLSMLTPRERQVVMHVLAGRSSKETARLLGISPRTVDVHRTRVLQKMRVRSALELAANIHSSVGTHLRREEIRAT